MHIWILAVYSVSAIPAAYIIILRTQEDMADLVEYAYGGVSTEWGAKRAGITYNITIPPRCCAFLKSSLLRTPYKSSLLRTPYNL